MSWQSKNADIFDRKTSYDLYPSEKRICCQYIICSECKILWRKLCLFFEKEHKHFYNLKQSGINSFFFIILIMFLNFYIWVSGLFSSLHLAIILISLATTKIKNKNVVEESKGKHLIKYLKLSTLKYKNFMNILEC